VIVTRQVTIHLGLDRVGGLFQVVLGPVTQCADAASCVNGC
jgi:hypothetical protein